MTCLQIHPKISSVNGVMSILYIYLSSHRPVEHTIHIITSSAASTHYLKHFAFNFLGTKMSMKSNTGKNMYADTSDESTSVVVIVR